MAQAAMPLDDALNKIAGMLGGTSAATTANPSATAPSSGGTSAALDATTRQRILNQIYYSQQIPPISRSMLLDMEQKLPELVDYLHSLAGRPAAQADLNASIDSYQPSTRSVDEQQRLNAIAQQIVQDAFGTTEAKEVVLVGVAIAAFMAGYTIVHNWNR